MSLTFLKCGGLASLSGPEPTLFGKPKFSCMRLHYRYKETSGYFHTLRAVMRNPEEDGKGTKCLYCFQCANTMMLNHGFGAFY